MTLVASEHRPTMPSWTSIKETITPDGRDALQTLMDRAVAAIVHGDSALLRRVVIESIDAFVACDSDPEPAAAQVAPLLWEVGEQHARRGFDADDLNESFRKAQVAAQRGLQFAVGTSLTHDAMSRLRQNVITFLQHLHRHAWIGWERTQVMLAMPDSERRDQLGSSLLRPADLSALQKLAEFSGIDLKSDYVLVVSAAGELPRALLDAPKILAGESRYEALVPATLGLTELADQLSTTGSAEPAQVVMGPPAPLTEIVNTAGPTRRGAELLREGLASDPRTVVPCTDLLASLVVDGNPKLTGLIVAKHLGQMEALVPARRLATAELLLQWLERGQPIRQIAREMGIPAQTAHSRMKNIRTLFGDALEDPAQRLELLIALQATLPRWRSTVEE